HALLGAGVCVIHVRSCGHRTRIDAEERERAHERVGLKFERKRGERLVVRRLAGDLLAGLWVGADDWWQVERRGQVVHDGIEHELHALVPERGAGENGEDLVGDDGLTEGLLKLLYRRLVTL